MMVAYAIFLKCKNLNENIHGSLEEILEVKNDIGYYYLFISCCREMIFHF